MGSRFTNGSSGNERVVCFALTGLARGPTTVPRALPWADLSWPLRGDELAYRQPPDRDEPESLSRRFPVRRARQPDEPTFSPSPPEKTMKVMAIGTLKPLCGRNGDSSSPAPTAALQSRAAPSAPSPGRTTSPKPDGRMPRRGKNHPAVHVEDSPAHAPTHDR
jgi:hypothetical protein